MAAGWWRQTDDNKLVAAADSLDTVPADHDFVLASTIEAAYTGIIYQLRVLGWYDLHPAH